MYTYTIHTLSEYIYKRMNTKLFLLLSHLVFLAPLLYLLNNPKKKHVLIHIILTESVMITSFFYHYCDLPFQNEIDYLHYCIMPFTQLYYLDFQLSALTAVNIISYNMDTSIIFIREIGIVLVFLFNAYLFGVFNNTFDNNPYFYSFTGVVCVCIVLLRGYTRDKRGLKRWWLPIEGNIVDGVVAALFFMAGFICFGLDMNDDYYIVHAGWHISCAVGLFFGYVWIDSFEYRHHKNGLYDNLLTTS